MKKTRIPGSSSEFDGSKLAFVWNGTHNESIASGPLSGDEIDSGASNEQCFRIHANPDPNARWEDMPCDQPESAICELVLGRILLRHVLPKVRGSFGTGQKVDIPRIGRNSCHL
ncbi:MAG: hypothetical protein GY820_21770 [Gammaproteobacteria bacterium]|nr:hypothetical protein [Gammaproteobacteria bacterium]